MVDTTKLKSWIERRKHQLSSRKNRIVAAASVFLALCAFGAAGVAPMAPDAADLPVRSVQEDLNLPSLAQQIAQFTPEPQIFISEEKVRSGDTLATLLQRLGVSDEAAATYIKSDSRARALMQLRPGRRVQASVNASGALQTISTTVTDGRDNPYRNIVVTREGERFRTDEVAAPVEKRIEMRTANIRSSLFAATDTAQIPDAVALQLVEMFSTNIDFASDLRRGDNFSVVYETYWQGGDYLRAGRVLAAEFKNAGATYQSVWFDEPGSRQGGGYYGFDGKSLKKAFLKSPLEFSRVSSGFSMRMHPLSGKWKQHKGVDFAAATGTPIRAAGEGVIEFAGVQGGYGNLVVIKHWSNYTTAYAHMSRFAAGIRKGSKISQGEVIGYVGSTGWSTGPHLHYEFRVNNQPRDPMTVDIPNAQPLAGAELQRFRTVASDMTHRLALLTPQDQNIKLAAR
ncbi:MAG: M23 family metallopeptidase [Lacisediminimonas sp.]|nr:M23 family metallopeptidase [Lacisediminimonas sp.]